MSSWHRRWAGAASWPEAVAVVRGATAVVTGSTIRPSLDVLVTLYPGVDGLPSLVQLVEAIAEQGLERVLSQLEEQHAVQRLVDAWIATSTWKDSFTYLKDHGDELRADAVQAMLGEAAKSGDATAQQHVAI